jgi:ankyrin repeat protein
MVAASQNPAAVPVLLEHGANPAAADADGFTGLIAASIAGHEDVVRALIAAGAPVDARANNGLTAIDAAEASNHLEVLAILKDAHPDGE